MKKTMIFTICMTVLDMLAGALLCAFIMKDGPISAPEAAAGLVWLLSVNALGLTVARGLKKKSAEEKKSASALKLLRGGSARPEPRDPAA